MADRAPQNTIHTFIEFGAEDYREANTRFLCENRDWRGLVIDELSPNFGDGVKDQAAAWA